MPAPILVILFEGSTAPDCGGQKEGAGVMWEDTEKAEQAACLGKQQREDGAALLPGVWEKCMKPSLP